MTKPVIFLAFADSRDDLPALKEERIALDDLLSAPFKVEQKDCATPHRIEATFRTYGRAVRIFHFAGHANGEQIALLEGSDGHSGGYVAGVAAYIGRQQGVELVFLNGCSTEGQVEHFRKAGVPALIATTAPVSDKVAREFAELFYANFVAGNGRKSLQRAFDEAKDQLMGRYESFPRLYSRSLDTAEIEFQAQFPYRLHTRNTRAGDTCYQDLLLPEEGEEKPVPPYAYLLCDRDESNGAFEDAVKDCLRQRPRRILACLVHGEEAELPLKLCERFRECTVQETFEKLDDVLETSRIEYQGIDMPRLADFKKAHKPMDRVRESLKLRLGLDEVPATEIRNLRGQQVLTSLDSHLKVVMLQHNLYAEDWDPAHSPAFLQEYLGEFWKVALPETGPEVLLLFSLKYPPQRGLLARLRRQENRMSEAFTDLAAVLDALRPVPRVDVSRWNDNFASDDPGLTDRLFGKNKELPMQQILPELKAVVDRRRKTL